MKRKVKQRVEGLKVAVVGESLFKRGGAENHLKEILNAFPKAELYTPSYDPKFVKDFFPTTKKIHHSFMQYLPKKFDFKPYFLLQPLAYKSFNFKKYDVIISLSIAFSKYANTQGIKHIDICMTPPKFLWQKESRSIKNGNKFTGLNKLMYKIYSMFMGTSFERKWQEWDREAARKCTKIVAISNVVKARIKKYYDMDADVIYPPVDVKGIGSLKRSIKKENWFLYLGRVETYKGVDLAIKACVKANVPLKIAGVGDNFDEMQELVKKLNAKGLVKFLGYVSEDEKFDLLGRARALLFPVRDEDFGITPVEANAAGTPVIAYREGGVMETISEENPNTGIFFDQYDEETLSKILKNFKPEKYAPDNCRKQANNFASEIFIYKLQNYVKDVIQKN